MNAVIYGYAISFVMLCASSDIGSQGYSRLYDQEQSMTMMSVRYYDDHLVLYGIILPPDSTKWGLFVAQLDTFGEVLRWVEIHDSTSSFAAAYHSTIFDISESGDIVLPLNYFGTSAIGLAVLDNELNVRFVENYTDDANGVTIPYSVITTSNGDLLVTGSAQLRDGGDVRVFLLRTDSLGNLKWLKYYGSPHLWDVGVSLIEIHENRYVIGGGWGNVLTNEVKSYIFEVDSLGNLYWSWNDPSVPDRVARGLHKEEDGSFVYMSVDFRPTTFPDLQYEVSVPIFIRRDQSMNLIDYKEVLPYTTRHELFNMIRSRDGGWIAIGSRTNRTDKGLVPPPSVYGRVVKLSHEGDIEWEVQDTAYYHPVNNSDSHLVGVTEAPSGSIYAVGYDNHRSPENVYRVYGWLLKITADGCNDTICNTSSIFRQIYGSKHIVKAYPNPTTDYLIFEIDERLPGSAVRLFDLHGRLIHSETLDSHLNIVMLDTRDFLPGMYVWSVADQKGRVLENGKVVVQRE